MQDRGAVGKCFVDGEHVGELFVDNLDCSNGSSCDLAAGRSDGCNWVAFPQDLFPTCMVPSVVFFDVTVWLD
ncbi:hypothetical protein N9P45_02530 [bacterium]|nr:hypothetical protein [bacterium]